MTGTTKTTIVVNSKRTATSKEVSEEVDDKDDDNDDDDSGFSFGVTEAISGCVQFAQPPLTKTLWQLLGLR